MRRTFVLLATSLIVSLAPIAPIAARQQVGSYPPPVQADFVINGFKFRSGGSLDLKIHYRTIGTVRKNAQGVVTNADILESIVGSFHTEEGPAEPAFVKRDDGSFLISGWMPALEFAALLDISLPASRPYQTCAGYLLEKFGAIPEAGQSISADGWRFEIVDLDGRRIDKVLAVKE